MAIRVAVNEYGTEVWVGDHMLACITAKTDQAATNRFIELVAADADRLEAIGQAWEYAVASNRAAKQGRNYPIFGQREREVNRLCKLAGIVDS